MYNTLLIFSIPHLYYLKLQKHDIERLNYITSYLPKGDLFFILKFYNYV